MIDVQRDTALQKLTDLTEENNKILKKMRRSQKMSSAFRMIYWLIILGVLFGSYYFIQPFLSQALNTYQGLLGTSDALQEVGGQIPGLGNLGELLGGLGGE